MLARGILLTLLVASGCGTSRPVSLDGAVDTLDALVCAAGLTDCNGKCVDTGNDPNNCGSCGIICDPASGGVCLGGRCSGSCLCPLGTCCSGSCVDLQSDDDNCGACGNKCDTANGFVCVAGNCECGGANITDCNGVCVDLSSDQNNCGSCGNSCIGACMAGLCWECPGYSFCNGACADTQSDNSNCGTCGNVCDTASGFTCISGTCSCVGGMTDCSGVCVNTSNDPNNCGTCGNVCCGSALMCVLGTCTASCPTGLTLCPCPSDPKCACCVDPNSDNNNCGACGTVCDTSAGFICQAGVCACPTAKPTDCGGTCVDTQTDPSNCGACSQNCPPGMACAAGWCGSCGPGLTNCNGTCVDLQTDLQNCGACGVACTAPGPCIGGTCPCSGWLPNYCNGFCVDLQTDESHCGSCSTTCSATEFCTSGVCTAAPPAVVAVTCAKTSLPAGDSTQCLATATLTNGATINVTSSAVWSVAKGGTCTGDPGVISNGPPSTAPIGTFTAVTPGCTAAISATYTSAGKVYTSNVVTVTVTS